MGGALVGSTDCDVPSSAAFLDADLLGAHVFALHVECTLGLLWSHPRFCGV